MFAVYPGDIVFSRIDARSGAIGVLQENIAKAVVTSEFPVFVPASEHLEGEIAISLVDGDVRRIGGVRSLPEGKVEAVEGRRSVVRSRKDEGSGDCG